MLDGVTPFPAEFAARYPSLPYERILRERDELGYHRSVMDLVFHANAERVLGL